MKGVGGGRGRRRRLSLFVALCILLLVPWTGSVHATDCYTEVDPYYWTFDVPSMLHVNTPLQAAQVRQSVVDYLWGGRSYPEELPEVSSLGCAGDPPPVRGPYPANFPQQFPGLVLWLDASDLTTITRVGSKVSRWDDKSGLNNHAMQNTATRQPVYSRVGMTGSPALLFDGGDDFMDAIDAPSLDVTQPTLFVVLQFVETTNAIGPTPLAKLPIDGAYLVKLANDGTPSTRVAVAEVQATADSVPVGTDPEVWSSVLDGMTLRMFRDGWQSETAPKAQGSARATTGPLRLGGADAGAQTAFSGWIAEVILYDGPLSEAERAQMESYLGWKYHIWRPWPRWISGVPGVRCVDRMETQLDYGLRSVSYLLKPAAPTGRISLFHQGHADNMYFNGAFRTIRRYLEQGHIVQTLWMPLLGENSKAVPAVPNVGPVVFANHDEMTAVLEDARGSFIRFFLEPVVVGLNYLETLGPPDITMTGVSGGGWATHLIAALDTRVSQSYPVAGSLPNYLRSGPCVNNSLGDSEQYWAPLYEQRATWLDLYALGSYGPDRKQVQILNQYDNCCFWGVNFQTYESHVANTVDGLGYGSFRVHLDSTEPIHQISQAALSTVIEPEMAAQPIPYAPRTDLRVSQYISDDPVWRTRSRDTLVYEIRVDNEGASKAEGTIVTVAPPQGSELISATPSQGTCSVGTPVTCTLGRIREAAAATLTIAVIPEPGLATNIVSATYELSDVLPANNISSLTIGVAGVDDRDGDGVLDENDCAPGEWTANTLPAEILNLRVGTGQGDRETVTWSPVGIEVGMGSTYDVLRGELPVPTQGLAAVCLASHIPASTFEDPAIPAARSGFWYLARGVNACGPGPAGAGIYGVERTVAPCP